MNKPQSITILRGYLFSKQSKKKKQKQKLEYKNLCTLFPNTTL